MGRPLSSIEGQWVGRVVYPFGRPGRLGRVVLKNAGSKQSRVWWRGRIEPCNEYTNSLMDFESLVLEAEKVAKNHRQRLEMMLKEKY